MFFYKFIYTETKVNDKTKKQTKISTKQKRKRKKTSLSLANIANRQNLLIRLPFKWGCTRDTTPARGH